MARRRRKQLGALGEPITGTVFLAYAGGAALLAWLLSKRSTSQTITRGSGGTQTPTSPASGSASSGTTTLPGFFTPTAVGEIKVLGPGVIQLPGQFVATKFEDKWVVSGEAKEKFPEYTVEYWLDLKRRNAASDVSDRTRSQTYESCRIYGGTKEQCSNLISTKSLEYCVFSEYSDSAEDVVLRECKGKLPNDTYIAQDMLRYA